jgi:hypothetical protein
MKQGTEAAPFLIRCTLGYQDDDVSHQLVNGYFTERSCYSGSIPN